MIFKNKFKRNLKTIIYYYDESYQVKIKSTLCTISCQGAVKVDEIN